MSSTEKNKNVLITGGTRGIGLDIARALLDLGGFDVHVCGRSLTPDVEADQRIVFHQCDLSNPEEIEAMAAMVSGWGDRAFGLINNAAEPAAGSLQDLEGDQILGSINLNIAGPVILSRAFLATADETRGGVIINILGAGAGWRLGGKSRSLYYAAKTWLAGFTEALGQEGVPLNVLCFGVSPGSADTELRRRILEDAGEPYTRSTGATVPTVEMVLSLLTGRPKRLTGRILSAQWDDLQILDAEIQEEEAQFGCLRRIDIRNFHSAKGEE